MTTLLNPGKEAGDKTQICEKFWRLKSPHHPDAYAPPWDGVARDLYRRLAAALGAPANLRHARAAVALGSYDEQRAYLAQSCRELYSILVEIAATAAVAEVDETKKPTGSLLPGEALVYDD